jgi:hypothetical protein
MTLWEKHHAATVGVFTDYEVARAEAAALRRSLDERGLTLRDAVIYLQQHEVQA